MAAIEAGSDPLCVLCGEAVDEDADAIATRAFLTKRDPLWRYAGGSMHRDCFLKWDQREEFVRKFNRVMEQIHRMDARGTIEDIESY